MRTATRITALWTAAAVSFPLASLVASGPAAAFHAGRSPDFPICNIWFNDQGKPLRNKLGREIGQEVPCPGQQVGRDHYRVLAGAATNTLVIRDETRRVECAMSLAPGSATVMVPTVCRPLVDR